MRNIVLCAVTLFFGAVHVFGDVSSALTLCNEGDGKGAVREMKVLAEKMNESEAQFTLGRWYDVAECGLKENNRKALAWYERAAAQGNPKAENNLGTLYLAGERGIRQDFAKALEHFKRAVRPDGTHIPEAAHVVGNLYASGVGVSEKNETLATEWYEKAVEQKYAPSETALCTLLYNGGENVPRENIVRGVGLCMRAAERGFAPAQYLMGVFYLRGVPGVLEKVGGIAALYFEDAARQGDEAAQFNLGLMNLNGEGIPTDYKAAEALIRPLAEKKSNPRAMFLLGLMYRNGHGVPQSDDFALAWFVAAREFGVLEAQAAIEDIVVAMSKEGLEVKLKDIFRDFKGAFLSKE